MAIVGIQLADFGLPAISDATCMQVSAALATLPTFFQFGELVPSDEGSLFAPDDLDDTIGKFSYHLCTEEFDDGLPSSTAIVYFSGLLGFTPDGSTFEKPGKYTPKLSAMIYCIRLCVLDGCFPDSRTLKFVGR
jgi:hypothetical protein